MSKDRHVWRPSDLATLRRLYPDYTAEAVAKVIGCSTRAAYNKAAQLGLSKSDAFKASDKSGRIMRGRTNPGMVASQFKKGHSTWNKGVNYVAGGRSAETRFKKGRKPEEARNYQPIGTLRLCRDGYLERKVTDDQSIAPVRRWVAVHRLVWEAVNGPIPSGHIVVFKPGMKTAEIDQITVDRLECISRAENARRNHPRTKSPELARLVQLKGAITRQVNRIAREAQHKESRP